MICEGVFFIIVYDLFLYIRNTLVIYFDQRAKLKKLGQKELKSAKSCVVFLAVRSALLL